MGAAYFYHLTRSPIEASLPPLLAKAREAGWRVAIRGTSEERLDWLDQKLWQGPDEGFLPHGMAGGPHDADQPVLLTTERNAANAPDCVMLIDGAETDVSEIDALQRLCILFDGNDTKALEAARSQWKSLTDAGAAAQYWSQEGGSWQKKAESG